MRRFVSNNVVFFFLVIIITIDASRIFYLPLPKIHSSQHELKSSPITEESEKKTHEKRSIISKFIPLSAMERNMYDEQEESESNIFIYLCDDIEFLFCSNIFNRKIDYVFVFRLNMNK